MTNPNSWTCKNCSYKCAADCKHCHTIQNRTVLIIFPLNLQTITITWMLSLGEEGAVESRSLYCEMTAIYCIHFKLAKLYMLLVPTVVVFRGTTPHGILRIGPLVSRSITVNVFSFPNARKYTYLNDKFRNFGVNAPNPYSEYGYRTLSRTRPETPTV